MIYIRKLEEKDAPLMLEWMKDQLLVEFLSKDFSKMELADCLSFIQSSREDGENIHRAVCNEEDEYLGTVSLKQVDDRNKNAEYAIAMRRKALGTGASLAGTREILRIAFEELELHRVYLNVVGENVRADRFYEKTGFRYEGTFQEHMFINGRFRNLKWYGITKQEYEANFGFSKSAVRPR